MLAEMGAYLQAQAVATLNTNLYLGQLPAEPTKCMALYEARGADAMVSQSGVEIERPLLQVVARGATYEEGRAFIELAFRALLAMPPQTINGTLFHAALPRSSPYYFDRDDDDNPLFCVYAELWKGLTPTGD